MPVVPISNPHTPNPGMAPYPATASFRVPAAPRAPAKADTAVSVPHAQAVQAAMQQYKEPGDPFTAFAQGFVNGRAAHDETAAEQAKRESAAELVGDFPDLQQAVSKGVLDVDMAIRLGEGRRAKAEQGAAKEAETSRRTQIEALLAESDPDLLEPYRLGLIDDDKVYKALNDRDDGWEPMTPDEKAYYGIPDQVAAQKGPDGKIDIIGEYGEDGTGDLDEYGFPKKGAISQNIRAYILQGVDEQTALGLATGRYKLSVNPNTGERSIVDMATQSIVPIKQPEFDAPQEDAVGENSVQDEVSAPTGDTLWDMAPDATGIGASIANTSSNTFGQLPGSVGEAATFPDSVKAQQEFDLFKRDLIRSLSVNPRFPVAEQKRIEDLVPRGALVAPETLKAALRSLDKELRRIKSEMERSLSDPNIPIDQKNADRQTLRGVDAALTRMGVPEDHADESNPMITKYGLTPKED